MVISSGIMVPIHKDTGKVQTEKSRFVKTLIHFDMAVHKSAYDMCLPAHTILVQSGIWYDGLS